LKEFDRCRPFFIAVLGGRYGWIDPGRESLLREELEGKRPATTILTASGVRVSAYWQPA
jgi:hypothetical protein